METGCLNSLLGAGKSSLANALLGCSIGKGEKVCMFGVCGGLESCTSDTVIGTGPWLGDQEDFTVRISCCQVLKSLPYNHRDHPPPTPNF